MRRSFFYDFSNYGSYDHLTDGGLTQWHPAFLQLGKFLDECAKRYKGFCQRYKPKTKPAKLASLEKNKVGSWSRLGSKALSLLKVAELNGQWQQLWFPASAA